MTRKTYVLAASLVVLCLACGKKPSEAPRADAPAGPASTPAPAPAVPPAQTGPTITKFLFGSALGPDGAVSAETSVLAAGDTACASFDLNNPAPDAKVRVAWLHQPDNKVVARSEASVTREKPAVSFKAETRAWPLGDYVMEISMASGDETSPLGTTTFKLQKDRPR